MLRVYEAFSRSTKVNTDFCLCNNLRTAYWYSGGFLVFVLNGGQGQTKDRTNLELRTTSDNSLVTCKKQISNESLNVKWIWNTYLEDFIKPACFLSVSDVM